MSKSSYNIREFHLIHSIREALEKLNELVDESDPDIDLPNIIHAFQGKCNYSIGFNF